MAVLSAVVVLATVAMVDRAEAHELRYGKAKRVAQSRADRNAGERTKISSLTCILDHECFGYAEWTRVDPAGCKMCGYNPVTDTFYDTPTTIYCSLNFEVRLKRSGRVAFVLTGKSCF